MKGSPQQIANRIQVLQYYLTDVDLHPSIREKVEKEIEQLNHEQSK